MGILSSIAKFGTRAWQVLQPDNRLATAAVAAAEGLDDYSKISEEGGNTTNVGNAIEHGVGNAVTGLLQTFMPQNGLMNVLIGWLINLFMGFMDMGKKIAGMMGYQDKAQEAPGKDHGEGPQTNIAQNHTRSHRTRDHHSESTPGERDQAYNNRNPSAEARAREIGANNPALSQASLPKRQDTEIAYNAPVPRPSMNNTREMAG